MEDYFRRPFFVPTFVVPIRAIHLFILIFKIMKQRNFTTVTNKFGMVINQCCASCAHREFSRLMQTRKCGKHCKKVRSSFVCDDWMMNEAMQKVGGLQGQVKCREYLLFVQEIRVQEQANNVEEMRSIESIRAEFEERFGSIFINI